VPDKTICGDKGRSACFVEEAHKDRPVNAGKRPIPPSLKKETEHAKTTQGDGENSRGNQRPSSVCIEQRGETEEREIGKEKPHKAGKNGHVKATSG